MNLSLPEALVLCDLDDTTGEPLADDDDFKPLLAAAMIGELELLGRILYDEGSIRLKPGRPVRLLEAAEHCLGARPTLIPAALAQIAEEDLRHVIHSHLVGLGALQVTSRRRLWWREYRWPTADASVENDLRDLLKGYVVAAEGPLTRTDMLLCLLERARLLTTVWPDPPVDAVVERAKLWTLRSHLRRAPRTRGVRMQDG